MARESYSEEFRRQAVDLYESTPGATLKGVAADLGVVRGTLRQWVDCYGTGGKTAPDGAASTRRIPRRGSQPSAGAQTPEATIARLEARVRELEAQTVKLTTEREILRSAARCFAGETRW